MSTNDILTDTARALFLAREEGPSYIGLRESVRTLVEQLQAAMFPRHVGSGCTDSLTVRRSRLAAAEATLYSILSLLLPEDGNAEEIVSGFLGELPEILDILKTDITAAYQGDPAARDTDEIILSYPAFTAISTFRLAHALFVRGVPILPRMMTELAHERTGIDIHPGATVGRYFFIDHGTGVVIGETTVIGKNVKLYQGVTLGALSFAKDPDTGALVKGIKRHPNVEDNVVIYAGATILGGTTVIGHDSEIGGNVWLKDSVPPNSRVYNKPPAPEIRTRT